MKNPQLMLGSTGESWSISLSAGAEHSA
jgi:hypothetical protein